MDLAPAGWLHLMDLRRCVKKEYSTLSTLSLASSFVLFFPGIVVVNQTKKRKNSRTWDCVVNMTKHQPRSAVPPWRKAATFTLTIALYNTRSPQGCHIQSHCRISTPPGVALESTTWTTQSVSARKNSPPRHLTRRSCQYF